MANRKKAEIIKLPEVRRAIGKALRDKRISLNLSLRDITFMSGIPKATVNSIEQGKTTNIDYYIEYAKTVQYDLSILFDIQIDLKPKYDLPEKSKNRIFLTQNIRELMVEEGLFKKETTVSEIIEALTSKKGISVTKELSTRVSGVLRNWVDEDGILTKRKEGRINYYRKSNA